MSLEPDSIEDAQALKAEGNEAWSKGDYLKAVEHFTSAIEQTPSDESSHKDFLKIIFSNRSAAYLKMGRSPAALKDANKCIQLDQDWPKGYTRKGDALLASKQFTEAYNAYNSGLRVAPNDTSLKEKAEQAMRAIQNSSNSSSSSSSSGSSSSSTANAPQSIYQKYLKIFSLVCTVLFLLPLGISTLFYRAAALASLLDCFLGLYLKHGFPQLNTSSLTEYGRKVLPDPLMIGLFQGALIFMNRPYLFAIFALSCVTFSTFIPSLFKTGIENIPAFEERISPMIQRFVPSLANVPLAQLFAPAQANAVMDGLKKLSVQMEIYQGIFLIIELVLPTRNILMLYIWWQFLQMRYMLDPSGQTKRSFYDLDLQIMTIVNHSYCPAIVAKGYGLLKSFLAKQVQMPTAESAGASGLGIGAGLQSAMGQAMSKCTIS